MIPMEFYMSIISLVFFTPIMILLWIKLGTVPSRAPLLLAISFMLSGSVYVGGVIASYLLTPRSNEEIASRIFGISAALSLLGLMLFSLTLLIPEFTDDVNFFLKIIAITGVYSAAATYNALTIELTARNNLITVTYDPIGIAGLLLSLGILTTITMRRIRKVQKILKNKAPEPFKTLKFQVIFALTIIIQFSTLALTRMNRSLVVPAFTWFLPSILTMLFLGWAIYQHPAFLFVTNHKLEGIFIIDRITGLVIYSETEDVETKTFEDVLSSILKGLNLSVKMFLDSQKPLKRIMFGDKVLLFDEGKHVITLMVLSRDNLIARDICQHLTYIFEEKYGSELEPKIPPDLNQFHSFSEITRDVRRFFVN